MRNYLANKLFSLVGLKVLRAEVFEFLHQNYDLAAIKRWTTSGATDQLIEFVLSNLEISNSQIQQDLMVIYILENGFLTARPTAFIEFGACDGVQLSNSLLLESRLSANGVLIEPSSKWFQQLKINRKAICLQKIVTNESGKSVRLFINEDPFLSTTIDATGRKAIVNLETVETISLEDVYGILGTMHVDYLSIDTEGNELGIISALNLDIYSAKIITIEHNYSENREKIFRLLSSKNYLRILTEISTFEDWYINTAYISKELVSKS